MNCVLVQFVFILCVCVIGSGVPADAVLIFELELLDMRKGIPQGFLFVWLEEIPDPLFSFMDLNQDGEVPLEEVFHIIVFLCFCVILLFVRL